MPLWQVAWARGGDEDVEEVGNVGVEGATSGLPHHAEERWRVDEESFGSCVTRDRHTADV